MARKRRDPVDDQATYALKWLAAAQAQRVQAEDEVERGVVTCRQFGVSWARIGRAIDMTADGARKRFNVDEVEALAAALRAPEQLEPR